MIPDNKRDLSKLPRWAVRRIESAERARDEFRRQLEEGPGDSDTFLNPYGVNKPVGINTRVSFVVAEGRHWPVALHVHTDEDHKGRKFVELHGAGGKLHIEPRTTNVVYVYLDEQ